MGPILVDIRGLQAGIPGVALGLLQTARAALPGRRLIGLVDPCLPPLAPPISDCLDDICADPHAATQSRPECFVRLAPDEDEPLFTARLLLDPTLPSLGLARPESRGLARYWQSRVDAMVPADSLWVAAAASRRSRRTSRLAVLSPAPDLPLCRALRRQGAEIFTPAVLPALSPHYDHTLFILTNSRESAPILSLLNRYGGSAVLLDSCLLAAYSPARAADLAERELGRAVPETELLQWQTGIARPAALLLGEVAAADRLFVHSTWLADEIARRYGRPAIVVPPTPDLLRIRAHASGLQAESCVWAVELLRSWGRDIRLDLASAPAEIEGLRALARRLDVADLVDFASGPAALTLVLSMRGQSGMSTLLAGAGLPCIASAGVAEAVDGAGIIVVPDQPSPPLLAEAIDRVLPGLEGADDAATRIIAALDL